MTSPATTPLPSPRSAFSRIPLWRMVLLMYVLAVSLVVAFQPENVKQHVHSFRNGKVDVTLDVRQLSAALSEADIRARMEGKGVAMKCRNEPGDAAIAPGGRSCFADIRSFNGAGSLWIVFWFSNDHLIQMKVDHPWWKHIPMVFSLLDDYGAPTHWRGLGRGDKTLMSWNLKQGVLVSEPIPSWNVLQWSSAVWMAQGDSGKILR